MLACRRLVDHPILGLDSPLISRPFSSMMSVTVVKQMVVQWGIKETWVPHQKDVDGVTYICLEKWNRQLVKFMYGRALDLRKDRDTKDLNVEMWTELVGLRQTTCDDMVALAHDDTEGERQKKRRRVRCTAENTALLPPAVQIVVPATGAREARSMQVLVEGVGAQTIWLELTAGNLAYLQGAFAASSSKPRAKAKAKASA